MLTALDEYGPDGFAQWAKGAAALGQQRMLVTVESQQDPLPRYDDTTHLAIAADIRLDNRTALGSALGISPAEQNQLSDSQLILQGYRRWGENCPNYFLGDFALAIWDPQTKVLFCARDPIGAKPFYYSLSPRGFFFASDIKGVLAAPGVSHQLDDGYIAASLLDKFFVSPDHTFFQAIRKLPPGHTLTVQPDAVRLEQYWFPERSPEVRFSSDAEYADAFLEIYTQAVHDRLPSRYSLGVHLSGGLDSSSIAVMAAREMRRQGRPAPATFCWQPPPVGSSSTAQEYALIQAVCAQEGLHPTYQAPSPEDILATFRRDAACEPTVGTLLNELAIQRQAATQGVRVLLSGWGGDEGAAFNGRGYFPELLLKGRWQRLYHEGKALADHPWNFILMAALLPLVHSQAPKFLRQLRQGKWPVSDFPLIHPDFVRRVKPLCRQHYREIGVRQTQLQLLANGHITARIEAWAASGAQNQIVYRYPLLDRRVLEFALGLPPEQFRRRRWNRWLMRNTLQQILPSEVCWNANKADPIRVQALREAIAETLPLIAKSLTSRSTPPTRAGYVDVPRLMEYLDADKFRADPKLGNIRTALQFLDLE
ncbi:MAG: asparagine synthase-related protein [Leptolyngbyaceae cyanobacterium MO_188.B28]|nr:asparagine synthase-related protein [Leptolyngbyaceae cyanobacterium MO_188.B28]